MITTHRRAAEHLLAQGNLSNRNALLSSGAELFFGGFGVSMDHEVSIQECALGHPTPLYVHGPITWNPAKVSRLSHVSADFGALAQWATMGAIDVSISADLNVEVKLKVEFAVLGASEINRLIEGGIAERATASLIDASYAYLEFIGRAIRFLLDENCAQGLAQMAIFDTQMFVENIARLIAEQ